MIAAIYNSSVYICFILALIISCVCFCKMRLYPAIHAARESVGCLLTGDLGHESTNQSGDELGSLCVEIELLRQKLVAEKRQQWENNEDMRKINAAFAHDMRTPLTIMQGYTEFLIKYIPQGKITEKQLLEKLEQLHAQQIRLHEFSKTMTGIRKLEMREVESRRCSLKEVRTKLFETAESLSAGTGIRVSIRITQEYGRQEAEAHSGEILVDLKLVTEVFENLMGNALRYAGKQITVELEYKEGRLTIYVKDDGAGFSPRALREASGAYYSEEKGTGEHFGMGLFICRSICKKHGGQLTLINSVEGGAIAAASFATGKL